MWTFKLGTSNVYVRGNCTVPIRQWCGSGFKRFLGSRSQSRSRRAKMTHKNRKKLINFLTYLSENNKQRTVSNKNIYKNPFLMRSPTLVSPLAEMVATWNTTQVHNRKIPCIGVVEKYSPKPQSKELTRGPPELVHHFRLQGEFTSAQGRCMS